MRLLKRLKDFFCYVPDALDRIYSFHTCFYKDCDNPTENVFCRQCVEAGKKRERIEEMKQAMRELEEEKS